MGDVKVSYTHKTWRGKPGHRYQVVDGIAGHGTEDDPNGIWWFTEEEAIAHIENVEYDFYTYVNGRKAYITIVHTEHGKELRSEADKTTRNNLAAMPDFPDEISDVI